jgi:hypothetical protein
MVTPSFERGTIWVTLGILMAVTGFLLLIKSAKRSVLLTETVTVEQLNDIKSIEDSLVAPVLYTNVQVLKELSAPERKKKFVDVVLPTILIYRHHLAVQKERLSVLKEDTNKSKKWSTVDSSFVQELVKKYRTSDLGELINRMEPPPVSLTSHRPPLKVAGEVRVSFSRGTTYLAYGHSALQTAGCWLVSEGIAQIYM